MSNRGVLEYRMYNVIMLSSPLKEIIINQASK